MDEKRRVQQASGLSIPIQQSNAPYLSITMRMFSTRPNRNGDGVTERFIDSIIENQAEHVGLPLYADTMRMRNREYDHLDHQYDPARGEYLTEEIGSFCAFEKVEDEYGVSLFGEARVYKRSQPVCAALLELYSRQMLNVSFEIAYDTLLIADGVEYIDASPGNVIMGMAVVTRPAYPEAVATRLVAQARAADDPPDEPEETERMNDMTLDEAVAKIATLETEVLALQQQLEEKPAPAEATEPDKDDAPTVPLAEHEAAVSAKDTELAALREQIAALTEAKEELDTLKQAQADADKARRQETLKTFAQEHGLDVEAEAVAGAIEALDYETVVAAAVKPEEAKPKTAAARPMSDLAVMDVYGGILGRTE